MHTETVKIRQEGIRTMRVSRDFIVDAPFHIARDQKRLHQWMAGQRIRQYWEPHGAHDIEVIRTTVVEGDPLVQHERTLLGNDEY
ncbi:MAG: hypothetical protein EBZ48_15980 [Proteobacteria bacterium]|nr:hypothetical protein [Pseudomonadota bacterium]